VIHSDHHDVTGALQVVTQQPHHNCKFFFWLLDNWWIRQLADCQLGSV